MGLVSDDRAGDLAAIIASQALISGAYSLTMQAIQLGFMPRLRIEHTSSTEWARSIFRRSTGLNVGCIGLSSASVLSNLAAA